MTKTSTSDKKQNLIEFCFEGECLQALQQFAHPSKSGDEKQVRTDLKRTSDLTIGNWSYTMSSETSTNKISAPIEPDLEEVFFYRIKRLDKKFQDFILLNFHQGGMFYSARQFLTFHLNSIGFVPNSSNGFRHHFICDFDNPNELIITEKFNITALDFVSDDNLLFKINVVDEEFSLVHLPQADKDKIHFLQEQITELFGNKASYQHKNLKLGKKFKDGDIRRQLLANSDKNVNLIEFSVKHVVTLDPKTPTEIKIKQLTKEDVKFKVPAELYELTATSEPEFSKLLSPSLQCVSSGFFKKPKLKSKLSEFTINNYQAFIIILFKILLNFCSPIILPEKASSLTKGLSTEAENSFAYRMLA